MSHKARRASATHRVDIGVMDDILIKGATALALQVGVLASPLPTTSSRVVTLRNHQNIIKLLQHAHSAVIPLPLRLTSPLFVFFLPFPPPSLGGEVKSPPRNWGIINLCPCAGPSHGQTGKKVIKIFNRWHRVNNNVKDELWGGAFWKARRTDADKHTRCVAAGP